NFSSDDPASNTTTTQVKAEAAKTAGALDDALPSAPADLKSGLTALDATLHQVATTGDAGALFAMALNPDVAKLEKWLELLCGISSTGTSSATTVPLQAQAQAACQLLTPADVSEFAGASPSGPAKPEDGSSSCA